MKLEEKIKIYVSKRTKEILDKDAELFEFTKKDGSINRNEFLNTLIINYYSSYEEDNKKMIDSIKKELVGLNIDKDRVSDKLAHIINQKKIKSDLDNFSEVLSLKPTKASQDTIIFIQNTALNNITLSNYFRDMFMSYTSLPQDEREKIIHIDVYNTLLKAIDEGKTISLITEKKPDKIQLVLPYKMSSSKEELFNYLLCEAFNKPMTFRLSRIKKAIINNEKAILKKEIVENLKLMDEYGPQYIINKQVEICVYLTDTGMEMFETHYNLRPVPYKKEGNYYYFKASKTQVTFYFRRFGYHAHIISPSEVEEEMRRFFEDSAREYRRDKSPKKEETRTFKKKKDD